MREAVAFRTVVDVGCGVGTWLAVARECGATETLGIEGAWVSASQLVDSAIQLRTHDLEQPVSVDRPYDLAICVEVAEHLSPARAATLIDDLCGASRRVLFSAAVPGQGGADHRNEQWQSYWARLFLQRGYQALDVIRHAIWTDERIPFWYRQNLLLYVHESEADDVRARYPGPVWALDVVHPELHAAKLREVERLRLRNRVRAVTRLPSALAQAIRRRLGAS